MKWVNFGLWFAVAFSVACSEDGGVIVLNDAQDQEKDWVLVADVGKQIPTGVGKVVPTISIEPAPEFGSGHSSGSGDSGTGFSSSAEVPDGVFDQGYLMRLCLKSFSLSGPVYEFSQVLSGLAQANSEYSSTLGSFVASVPSQTFFNMAKLHMGIDCPEFEGASAIVQIGDVTVQINEPFELRFEGNETNDNSFKKTSVRLNFEPFVQALGMDWTEDPRDVLRDFRETMGEFVFGNMN